MQTTLNEAIYNATKVHTDNQAIIDEIWEAINNTEIENDDRQWITGQDDAIAQWEYFVEYHVDEDLDENGDLLQAEEHVKVLQISITPRSKSSVFARAGYPLQEPIHIDVNVEL